LTFNLYHFERIYYLRDDLSGAFLKKSVLNTLYSISLLTVSLYIPYTIQVFKAGYK